MTNEGNKIHQKISDLTVHIRCWCHHSQCNKYYKRCHFMMCLFLKCFSFFFSLFAVCLHKQRRWLIISLDQSINQIHNWPENALLLSASCVWCILVLLKAWALKNFFLSKQWLNKFKVRIWNKTRYTTTKKSR